MSVVVVGSYNHDHVWRVDRFAAAGETRRGRGFVTHAGGKGFNQAVACVRQGAITHFIGALGTDAIGRIAQDLAHAESLRCHWSELPDWPSGTAGILVEDSGQNQIVVDLGANEHLAPEFVRAHIAAADARVLLCQLENNLDAVRAALSAAAERGMTRIINPAPVHPDLDLALLQAADIVTPNETEFALLLARFADEQVDADGLASRSDAELHALARKLGGATVVLTLGSAGGFVSHAPDQRRGDASDSYRYAPERVKAIDTTGAGDAFSGALAAALVLFPQAPFWRSVAHANRAAALSTESAGGAPAMPTRSRVVERFGD